MKVPSAAIHVNILVGETLILKTPYQGRAVIGVIRNVYPSQNRVDIHRKVLYNPSNHFYRIDKIPKSLSVFINKPMGTMFIKTLVAKTRYDNQIAAVNALGGESWIEAVSHVTNDIDFIGDAILG